MYQGRGLASDECLKPCKAHLWSLFLTRQGGVPVDALVAAGEEDEE